MSTTYTGYLAISGIMCGLWVAHRAKVATFETDAFKAQPPEQQRRAVRNARIMWSTSVAFGVVLLIVNTLIPYLAAA